MNPLDAKDQEILNNRIEAREQISGPRIGDYVRFPSGELERFSHDWRDSLQTSPPYSGEVYLLASGNGSFSGGLNPSIPVESLTLTEEFLPGKFWFFHHNTPGAGRGVYFSIPCRVYSTTTIYNGFLGKS
jgi:hypothetical protein